MYVQIIINYNTDNIAMLHSQLQLIVVICLVQLDDEGSQEAKELYLCGQCNMGYTSMDECKQHMEQVCSIYVQFMFSNPSI